LKRLLDTLCGLLAAVALMAIMLLTLVDVSGRKLLSQSVPGSLELTELLMVVVIFAALPMVSLHREHVVFDSLDRFLPPLLARVQQALVELLCAALMAGLAWVMWSKGAQMAEYGDITPQLQLPLSPFVRGMGVLCGVTAAVHAVLALLPRPAASSGSTPGSSVDGAADTAPDRTRAAGP
jgi:TRAP-type C4-dicarboxylate transport system permease small subunit